MAKMAVLLKKPSFIFRIVELMITMVAVGISQNSSLFMKNIHDAGLVYTVTSGFVLILFMHILERIIEETTSKKMALIWSFVGAVLWFAAGGLIVYNYNYVYISNTIEIPKEINNTHEVFLAAGIVAIVNGFVFLADLAITSKFE